MHEEALALACAPYRAAEVRETALMVVQDKDLQRVLAVWPLVDRLVMADPQEAGKEGWERLWSAVVVDEKGFEALAGFPTGRGIAALARARRLHLIYPDGTVHQYGNMVVQKLIKDALQG